MTRSFAPSVATLARCRLLLLALSAALAVPLPAALAGLTITGDVSPTTAPSTWTSSTTTHIGNNSTGTLTVNGGSGLLSEYGYLGYNSAAMGTVSIDGAGSTWTNAANLDVGYYGTGTLNITNGASVSDSFGYIGYFGGATGTVTVDGAGSTWNSSDLMVGLFGTGTLNITNGSAVSAPYGTTVGSSPNGAGAINFGSNGGTLTTGAICTLSSQLSGVGTINANGLATDLNLVFDSTHGLKQTFALNSLPNQNVTINLDMSTPANNVELGAGCDGNGSLTIRDGIAVQCGTGFVSGTATIQGPGSTWGCSDMLSLGALASPATLNIVDGGALTTAAAVIADVINSAVVVKVDGVGSALTSTNQIEVGYIGNGSLSVTNGGVVSDVNGLVSCGWAEYDPPGGTPTRWYGQGAVTVDGAGSKWINSSSLGVGNAAGGTLKITNGGFVSDSGCIIGGGTVSSSTVTVDGAGSKWSNTSSLYVGANSPATLSISGGGAVAAASLSIGNSSLLAIDVGRGSSLGAGAISNAGTVRILAGADVAAGNTYSPISAGTWSGSGTYQAVGGTWNATSHSFTASAVQAGAAGTPVAIDLSQTQRVLVTDTTTGESIGASFLAATGSTPITFTASLAGGSTLTSLESLLEPGQSVSGAWTCSAAGYASANPTYLSVGDAGNGGGYYMSGLEVWSYNSSGWAAFPASDLTYDGTYASFTTTSLGTFALTGTAVLPGDANRDGSVDINDLTIVLANYNRTGTTWSQGEFTGDGTVDINDLTIVLASYDQRIASSAAGNLAAVPEPSALALLAAAVVGLVVYSKLVGLPFAATRPARPQAVNRG